VPSASLPTATAAETLGVLAEVVAPPVAKGPILRRRVAMSLFSRLDLDGRAIRRLQRLRRSYPSGPLMLTMPGPPRALVLRPEDVRRILDGAPDPFVPDTPEKHAALAHFEPRGVLVSRGLERTERRRYNEAVLEPERPMHGLGERFVRVAEEEAAGLLESAPDGFGWPDFSRAWHRMARRWVLGDGAREDEGLTDDLRRLRARANWVLPPIRRRVLRRFSRRLEAHLDRAEPGSLAGLMAATPAGPHAAPAGQVPQWLFAFDSAGIATARALALLTTHPDELGRVRVELSESARPPQPRLRAAVLESLRLWPTTPLVLRQTTRTTEWEVGSMPAGTGVVIYAPFFHRDGERQPFADRFTPELWLRADAESHWPLIPFSRGPAECPGRQLALLAGSAMLATLLRRSDLRLERPPLVPDRPLPGTLDHFALRFTPGPRNGTSTKGMKS
jgi:cytochrome P450